MKLGTLKDRYGRTVGMVDEFRGIVATEYQYTNGETDGEMWHRPIGVMVIGATRDYWMYSYLQYDLVHDGGHGWRVMGEGWAADRICWLAGRNGEPTDTLPLLAGGYGRTPFMLAPETAYALVPTTPFQWLLTKLMEPAAA